MNRDTTRIGAAYERMHATNAEYAAIVLLSMLAITVTAIFGVWLAWTIENTWTAINRDLLDVPADAFLEE